MKRLFLAFTLLLSTTFISAFANDANVNPQALKSFKKLFTGASNVSWFAGKDFYKAEFVINNQKVSAFFNQDGELIGTGRRIRNEQLPIVLQVNLKTKATGHYVTELLEVNNEAGTHYYATLESSEKTLIVKSNASNEWATHKKIKK